MKIPEMWPTEEMINAAIGVSDGLLGPILAARVLNAALTAAPTPPTQEDEPRLVSYGLDLETCTLNYQGEEYYFERTSTTAQECKCDTRTRLIGDGCEICNPELAKEMETNSD